MLEFQNVVRRALQNFTQPFQSVNRNPPVVFEVVDGSGIYMIRVYEGISRDVLTFHGFPKRFKIYHGLSPSHKSLIQVLWMKDHLEILKNVSIFY